MRNWNREYLDFAQGQGLAAEERRRPARASTATRCRRFRLAAQGKTPGRQPPEHLRERIATYFDPLPFWYAPLEDARDRPRAPIRSTRSRSGRWRCTTRGIRRTRGCARSTATTTCTSTRSPRSGRHRRRRLVLGREPWGQVRCMAALQRGGRAGHGVDLERDRQGRRRLAARARRRRGEEGLPPEPPDQRRAAARRASGTISNSDPITGQAGWYDVRVRIRPPSRAAEASSPQIASTPALPGCARPRRDHDRPRRA